MLHSRAVIKHIFTATQIHDKILIWNWGRRDKLNKIRGPGPGWYFGCKETGSRTGWAAHLMIVTGKPALGRHS
jgi:hypothetical protein